MREIIFRGKLLSTGEWTEGNLAVSKTGAAIISPDATPIGKYGQVDPETVGQFTGLLDKNGKKIFEGDVVRSVSRQNEVVGVMVFQDGSFELDCISFDEFSMWQSFSMSDLELGQVIIGNIHDNPELLEANTPKPPTSCFGNYYDKDGNVCKSGQSGLCSYCVECQRECIYY